MANDWDILDTGPLFEAVRGGGSTPDAEKMIWAFERCFAAARIDQSLLDYLLAAVVCLLARSNDCSPRHVLEMYFRRALTDEEWRDKYRPLFG